MVLEFVVLEFVDGGSRESPSRRGLVKSIVACEMHRLRLRPPSTSV